MFFLEFVNLSLGNDRPYYIHENNEYQQLLHVKICVYIIQVIFNYFI